MTLFFPVKALVDTEMFNNGGLENDEETNSLSLFILNRNEMVGRYNFLLVATIHRESHINDKELWGFLTDFLRKNNKSFDKIKHGNNT